MILRTLRTAMIAAAVLAVGVCAAAAQDERRTAVELEPVAQGLTAPVFLTEPDDDSGRRFVVDQPGRIRIIGPDGGLLGEPFLDISDRTVELDPSYDERGLLGLAFHPGYADNGRFFVYYSAPARDEAPDDWSHTNQVSEFRVSGDDPDRADPGSERVVMRIDQPFANHNAGHIAFGDDGHLYIPLGDGGNGGDVDPPDDDRGRPEGGNAQTVGTLLGSILRIDVDGEQPYAVPDDNPLVGAAGRDEIWAYGLRNPFGLSIDRDTGDLYVAQAGQALWEEANLVERGGNYGWNIKEGTHCFNPDDFVDPPEQCPDVGPRDEPLIDPIVEYRRGPESGSTITSGVRYRGDRASALDGMYVFGDYSRIRFQPDGVLYAAEPREEGLWEVRELRIDNPLDGRSDGELHRFVLAVSQDRDGELYVLTTREGGPTGDSGEVFALSGTDEDGGGLPWWAWAAIGAGVVALLAAALLAAGRRTRGPPGAGETDTAPS